MTPKLSILTPVWNQEVLVIRNLDSIPRRDDIEVIVRDDGSTDKTLENLREYTKTTDLNLKVCANRGNHGVAYTANRLLKMAKGEFFHFLMSDDTAITDAYNSLIDRLYDFDGDILTMDLRVNDGRIFALTPQTDMGYCAQACRFIRRSIVEGIQYQEDVKAGEDLYFHREMMKRNPKVVYSGVVAYRYNFPREGSLYDLMVKGVYPSVV